MEQGPWEANWLSASQEIYGVYKCLPPVPVLSQIKPVHALHLSSWRSILILFSHLCLGLASGLFPSGFSTKTLFTLLLSPLHATCFTHLILYLITQIVLGEQYRPLSYVLCRFVHSPVTSSLLGPNMYVSTLFSKHPHAYVSPSMWVNKFHIHTKQQAKL